jgi:hypothetical protein
VVEVWCAMTIDLSRPPILWARFVAGYGDIRYSDNSIGADERYRMIRSSINQPQGVIRPVAVEKLEISENPAQI